MQPITFHYLVNKETDPLAYGFLAQDVLKIFPEFMSERDGGYYGIAYSNFGVVAIKAIQEQQGQLQMQQKENAELKSMLLEMKKRIEVLEIAKK